MIFFSYGAGESVFDCEVPFCFCPSSLEPQGPWSTTTFRGSALDRRGPTVLLFPLTLFFPGRFTLHTLLFFPYFLSRGFFLFAHAPPPNLFARIFRPKGLHYAVTPVHFYPHKRGGSIVQRTPVSTPALFERCWTLLVVSF